MTAEGERRTWEAYGPMVAEGQQAFASFTIAQLEGMRDLLEGMTELTERHRARVERPSA